MKYSINSLLCVFLLVLSTPVSAENLTVEKGLAHVRQVGERWIEKRGCVSCHQVPSMLWAHQSAADARVSDPDERFDQWKAWSTDVVNFVKPAQKADCDIEATMASNIDTMTAMLLALPADPNAEYRARFSQKLISEQKDDGSWQACGQLPMQRRPERETLAVTTLWTTLALLKENATFDLKSAIEFSDSVADPVSAEWYAARLLVEAEANGDPKSALVKQLIGNLVERQNSDGGWGWRLDGSSDALGTGYALYSLAKVDADAKSIGAACRYLIDQQHPSGKWSVPGTKKSAKGKPTPTATDWGTAWAVISLIESSPPTPSTASNQEPEADPAGASPVKVFILSGQSNMVGAGKFTGGSGRWGKEFLDPEVFVYEGAYDPEMDYDNEVPRQRRKLPKFGGVKPTPFPADGTRVVRGWIQVKKTGVYEFRPGYGDSTYNVMEVDGVEVHRKEVGSEAVTRSIKLASDTKVPFKITFFTDAAAGLGWLDRVDTPGALTTLVKQKGMYPFLINPNHQWQSRDDVWYRGVIAAKGNHPLGVRSGRIGPELGFGHVVGEAIDGDVLLLKTSQGNRSLGWDFLPPGSERYEHDGMIYAGYKDSPSFWEKGASKPEPINWYAGKQYDDCFGAAHEILDNFDREFPHWKGRGYEIAGFVWWQGDKDRYNEGHAIRYEKNLVHFIKTLREEFDVPDAPFVCATLGQTSKESDHQNERLILEAQLAVDGKTGKYPALKGNVATVYTHPLSRGGASNSHYNGNAQTYMDVGIAIGNAMIELLR